MSGELIATEHKVVTVDIHDNILKLGIDDLSNMNDVQKKYIRIDDVMIYLDMLVIKDNVVGGLFPIISFDDEGLLPVKCCVFGEVEYNRELLAWLYNGLNEQRLEIEEYNLLSRHMGLNSIDDLQDDELMESYFTNPINRRDNVVDMFCNYMHECNAFSELPLLFLPHSLIGYNGECYQVDLPFYHDTQQRRKSIHYLVLNLFLGLGIRTARVKEGESHKSVSLDLINAFYDTTQQDEIVLPC